MSIEFVLLIDTDKSAVSFAIFQQFASRWIKPLLLKVFASSVVVW